MRVTEAPFPICQVSSFTQEQNGDSFGSSIIQSSVEAAAFTKRAPNLLLRGYTVNVCSMAITQKTLEDSLRKACKDSDYDKAKKLMKKGANPFVNPAAISLTMDLKMILILLGVENAEEFEECVTVHDFCDMLFPKAAAVLDTYEFPNWMPCFSFDNGGTAFEIGSTLEQRLPKADLANILQFLQTAPHFQSLWRKAKAPKIEEVPESYFEAPGKPSYGEGEGAEYDPIQHVIRINKKAPLRRKIAKLIFELLNAAQKARIEAVFAYARTHGLDREEFTVIMERMEFDTYEQYQKMLQQFGLDHDNTKRTFSDYWKRVQTPFLEGGVSHADSYRYQWDYHFLTSHLKKCASDQRS
jgi:hypothetical protein